MFSLTSKENFIYVFVFPRHMETKKIIKELAKKEKEQDIAIKETLALGGCNERYGPFKHLKMNLIPNATNTIYEMYSQELDGMIYGTYQKRNNGQDLVNTSYGSGPSRLMSSAKYSTNQLLTFKEVPLLSGIFSSKPTKELQEFLELQCLMNNKQEIQPPFQNNYAELSSGKPTLEGLKQRDENLALIISNVKKEGNDYFGELSIRSSEVLGYGKDMIKDKNKLSLKTSDAFEAETYESTNLMSKTFLSFDQQKLFEDIAQEFSKKINTPFEKTRILNTYNL